jgi:hypothetical protein
VSAEAERSGRTAEEVLEEVGEAAEEGLESGEEVWRRLSKGAGWVGGRAKSAAREDESEVEDSDEEVEEVEMVDAVVETDKVEEVEMELDDSPEMSDAEDVVEGKEEKKWNVGALMRASGVDPGMFGWDEDEEDFVD